MAILSKGTDFSTGDQVTAANLDALVDSATFAAGAVDDSTTALDSSSPQRIIVKNGGISTTQLATSSSTTTGVTFEKMQHVAANTVLVNDTNAEGDISAKAVADTQILIGDGTGFTAAALSGDATMTNAGVVDISNDVALGGNPTTTTQSAGNNTTRVATTAFVTTAVAASQVIPPFNRLRIKISPSDFGKGTSVGNEVSIPSSGFIYASTDIPAGYKATHFTLTTTGNSASVEVFESQVGDGTLVSKGSNIASGTRTLDMTDVTGSDNNYLVVKLGPYVAGAGVYYGGYFTIAAV